MKKLNLLWQGFPMIVILIIGTTMLLAGCGGDEQASVASIEITNEPIKTNYTTGEIFDSAGLEIEATYLDNTKRTLTIGFTLTAGDIKLDEPFTEAAVDASPITVTVNFRGATDNFTIHVLADILTHITAQGFKPTYNVNEAFSTAGLTVTAYLSNTSKVVTDYTLFWGNDENTQNTSLANGDTNITASSGIKYIKVVYSEDSVTREVVFAIAVGLTAESITIASPPEKTEYAVRGPANASWTSSSLPDMRGETFNPAGLTVTAAFPGLQTPVAIPATEYTLSAAGDINLTNPFNNVNHIGTIPITVSYGELETEFNIVVYFHLNTRVSLIAANTSATVGIFEGGSTRHTLSGGMTDAAGIPWENFSQDGTDIYFLTNIGSGGNYEWRFNLTNAAPLRNYTRMSVEMAVSNADILNDITGFFPRAFFDGQFTDEWDASSQFTAIRPNLAAHVTWSDTAVPAEFVKLEWSIRQEDKNLPGSSETGTDFRTAWYIFRFTGGGTPVNGTLYFRNLRVYLD